MFGEGNSFHGDGHPTGVTPDFVVLGSAIRFLILWDHAGHTYANITHHTHTHTHTHPQTFVTNMT